MEQRIRRRRLPRFRDRLPLGSGLMVSPVCLGLTGSPDTVLAAYDAGINFFFVTADLHWPLYESTRRGLAQLLGRSRAIRDHIVVGVVSYLGEPMFSALQFHEVLAEIPGLERIDLVLAGAVTHDGDCLPRLRSLHEARWGRRWSSQAVGASFHSRPHALQAINLGWVDIAYIRYNPGHPGARRDLLPYLRPDRRTLIFNFKSTISHVPSEQLRQLGLRPGMWQPDITDQYRFVLGDPRIDGILASPMTPAEVTALDRALAAGPLDEGQEQYLMALASAARPRLFE